MTHITPHTKIEAGDYNEAVNRQIRSTVTIDPAHYDAWLELIDATEGDELSDAAQVLYDDHFDGRGLDGVTMGDYLEGILDYRTLRDSSGEVIEVHLLVGFGGPNVWHEIDGEGNVSIRVHWWGTTGRGDGNHDFFARAFDYMVEVVACT